jgi:hypothetical protein
MNCLKMIPRDHLLLLNIQIPSSDPVSTIVYFAFLSFRFATLEKKPASPPGARAGKHLKNRH